MSPDAIKLAVAKSPSALITVREKEGGPWPPQYFGHALPRKFRKSSYKPRFQNEKVVDKVSRQILGARQILKAMQIPEAQFLIINAGEKASPRNYFLAPLI